MADRKSVLARLRSFNLAVQESDSELAAEIDDRRLSEELAEVGPGPQAIEFEIAEESIIMRRHRPVLRVLKDTTELVFASREDSEIWRVRLNRAKELIDRALKAVGRINLEGSSMDWVGTGWMVHDDIIVTNRHVAEVFVESSEARLIFRSEFEEPIKAEIDFLQEFDCTATRAFRLLTPLWIAPKSGPDIAFFRVELVSGDDKLAEPITLSAAPRETNNVATIGYPAFDSRIPDLDLMQEIYGHQYDKKRLAPGAVTFVEDIRLLHNCTTLGGNSGSSVLCLDSGEAMGLHFSGAFLKTNFAVRSDVVQHALNEVLYGRGGGFETHCATHAGMFPQASPTKALSPMIAADGGSVASKEPSVTMTVPLTITVSLGTPRLAAPMHVPVAMANDEGIEDVTEGRPEDYQDREGFRPDFIAEGENSFVPLPVVQRNGSDVLGFQFDGRRETELRYRHFSVVMSKRRRLCYFSAVNVDGSRPVGAPRVAWKFDPRIPREAQIMKECYGPPPRFGRGHMTRRKDSSWGTQDDGRRGNWDTMHVTNAAPQMQAFNAPIWLELEDYALDHAIKDDMKISVFTGPFFRSDDPLCFGVQIPVSFWKVIAFIHDDTHRLTATGYRLS